MDDLNQNEPSIVIRPDNVVTVTRMNHVTEIQYMERMNTNQHIQKLSGDEYVDLKTGEIKEFEKTENRSEGQISLYKTFKKLRYLINNNFVGSANELFVTLTFEKDSEGWRPSVGDTKYLAKACKSFQEKLKRKYGDVEFIRILEPHDDGHAHYHMLIRFDGCKKIFIPNNELNKLWGQGFVKINSLKDVDNIGAYVSAYLADIELNAKTGSIALQEGSKVMEKEVNGETKRFVKGGRLRYYPTGTQIYNKSKGIKEPDRKKMKYKNAKKIVGSAKPTFEKDISVETDEFSNKIRYESYNSKRK